MQFHADRNPRRVRRRDGAGELLARLAAAVFGGYLLSVAVSTSLSLVLPMARADAVLTGLLVSFTVYALAILWAFAVRSLSRMWLGLLGLAVACGVLTGVLVVNPMP